MKKLLVIALVLSVATVASANFAWLEAPGGLNVAAGETFSVNVVGDGSAWWYDLVAPKASVVMGEITMLPAAGDMAEVGDDWSDDTLYDIELISAGSPTNPTLEGLQWVVDFTVIGEVGSTFDIYMYEYGSDAHSTLSFNVVPEPMTIALLGLGGLFLRRRK